MLSEELLGGTGLRQELSPLLRKCWHALAEAGFYLQHPRFGVLPFPLNVKNIISVSYFEITAADT